MLLDMGAIAAEVVDTGEKHDSRGRRIVAATQRRRLMEAFRSSGVTMAQFARREGVNYSTMAGWVHREAIRCAAPKEGTVQFTQVQLPATAGRAAAQSPSLEVQLPDGTLVRASRIADMVALIRALRV